MINPIMNAPRFSVVMSVYKDPEGSKAAAESVLKQSFTDLELIVVDDGSHDSRLTETLESLRSRDSRVRLIKNSKNIGLTKSLNKALAAAEGEYIARIDAKDFWAKNKLMEQSKYLDKHKDTVLLGTQARLVYEDTGIPPETTCLPVKDEAIRLYLLRGRNPFIHSAVVFKAGSLYDENFIKSQDHELWTRLFFNGEMANLQEPLVDYDISGDSLTYKMRPESIFLDYMIYKSFTERLNRKAGERASEILIPYKKFKTSFFDRPFSFFYGSSDRLMRKNKPAGKLLAFFAFCSSPRLLYLLLKKKALVCINYRKYPKKTLQPKAFKK